MKSKIQIISVYIICVLCSITSFACSNDKEEVSDFPQDWIDISKEDIIFDYQGGNISRSYIISKELHEENVKVTLSPNGDKWLTAQCKNGILSIHCERSYLEEKRTSVLTLEYAKDLVCKLLVSQEAAPNVEDILIKVVDANATSEEDNGKDADGRPLTLKMSYDGNKKTYFNSKFGKVSYPFNITYTLKQGYTLNRIVYTPRNDSGNKWGSFEKFDIEASTYDEPDNFIKLGSYERGNGIHTEFNIKLPMAVRNVKQVRFVVNKAYEDRVSCAEMEFYQDSENKFDPASIFSDSFGLILKEGVTEKQINQIPNETLKELGLALLNGDYNTQYRVAEYRPYQDPSVMAAINKTSKYSLRDNPTGIYARDNEVLSVFVDKIYAGGKLFMLVQDLNGGYNNFSTYKLTEGYNEVTISNGGLIYILNHIQDDIPLSVKSADAHQQLIIKEKTVKVHFAMGKINGYFDIQKNQASDWIAILEKAAYRDIDVMGNLSHITWSVADFKKYQTDIVKTVENFDRLVALEQEFMGLEKYKDKQFNNRMHFAIDYKTASPNASDYRTVYNDGAYYAEPFCIPERFAQRCWGPAHEVGHCNQTRPGLKWFGTTEVTNNIMSLYVQTSLGIPCKLQVDGCSITDESGNTIGRFSTIYEAATELIINGKRAHSLPNINKIVRETQLVPFWQLKLYMIDVMGKKDFYHDLYEYYRTHKSPSELGENQGMNQLDFVRQVCAISKLNMLTFFEKWGFLTPVNTTLNDYGRKKFIITKEQIEELKLEINRAPYGRPHDNVHEITDNNFQNYK